MQKEYARHVLVIAGLKPTSLLWWTTNLLVKRLYSQLIVNGDMENCLFHWKVIYGVMLYKN